MHRLLLLSLALLLNTYLPAQTIINCGDTFFDSGGAAGNYPDDANEVYQICPTVGGEVAKVSFALVDLEECCDEIEVFNGAGTTTSLGFVFNASQFFISTAADGCLTVVLRSDGSVNEAGFEATISCAPPPTCPQPSSLNLDGRTSTSATLSWTENGTATLYDLIIVPAGTAPGATLTDDDVGNPFTVTGLTAGTDYDAYVRADCDGAAGTDDSDFTGPFPFATLPPPPGNDECGMATPISISPDDNCTNQIDASLAGATSSTPAPSCGFPGGADVWYTFTPTNTVVNVLLDDPNFGEGDFIAMEVYAGSCGSLTSLSCGENTVRITGLTANTPYFIRVFGDSGSQANYGICVVSEPDPPTNDDCGAASVLSVSSTPACASVLAATTAGATESLPGNCGAAPDDDVWFSFTAANDVHLLYLDNVSAVTGFNRDLYYEVFAGSCGALTSIICENFPSFDDPPVSLSGLTNGTTYFLRVYSEDNSGTVSFDICIATPPPNDECSGALVLPVNPTYECTNFLAASTTGATQSGTDCGFARADDDVWFSFVATRTDHLLFVTDKVFTGGFNTQIYYELNTGTNCGTLTAVECAIAGAPTELRGLTIGATYFLRVFTRISGNTASFNICLSSPPPNDNCTEAILAPINPNLSNTITTAGTSLGGTESFDVTGSACSNFANDDDVWYAFEAIAIEHRVSLLNISPVGGFGNEETAIVRLYSGTCAALMELQCGFLDGDLDEEIFTGLVAGTTYYLTVQSLGSSNDLTFDLSIKTNPALLPVTLLSFRGEVLEKENWLYWSTASEESSEWHVIERSLDGATNWQEVARTQGAGDSEEEQNYRLADPTPTPVAFYRLRTVDYDGQFQLSPIIRLERKGFDGDFLAFPNPTESNLTVTLTVERGGDHTLSIFDLNGRMMLETKTSLTSGEHSLALPTQALAIGIYLLNHRDASGQSRQIKFVKR
ncbi:MAG: fibronectin type III domain-containing protein [Bacteroidota bacterium]